MSKFLQEAKAQLTNNILLREHWVEIECFDQFLAQASFTEQVELARWMYEENHLAFTSTRIKAGLFLYHKSPDLFWMICDRLGKSNDLDDLDTVGTLLCDLNDPKGHGILKLLMHDQD